MAHPSLLPLTLEQKAFRSNNFVAAEGFADVSCGVAVRGSSSQNVASMCVCGMSHSNETKREFQNKLLMNLGSNDLILS